MKIAEALTAIHRDPYPSHPVVPDDYNSVQTIKLTSKVTLPTSEVLLNQNIFKNFYMILYISPMFLMRNNKQLLSAMKS